jgi:hypothetical protein
VRILGIGDEGDVSGGGFLDAGDAGDVGLGGSVFELSLERFGELGEFHKDVGRTTCSLRL